MINETQNYSQDDINATKGLAALSYLGIFFLIPLFTNKNSAFTKFHVNQGIAFLIFCIVISVLSFALTFASAFVPAIGWLLSIVGGLLSIVPFIFMLIGIINAVQGKAIRLPIIGNIQILK